MPKLTRNEIKERERFVVDTWKRLWRDLKPGGNLPAARVNEMIHVRFHENMRSDKVYRLRDQAIQELREAGVTVSDPPRKRKAGSLPAVMSANRGLAPQKSVRPDDTAGLPQIFKGLAKLPPTQAVETVINALYKGNLVNLTVEHSGEDYVVINVAR